MAVFLKEALRDKFITRSVNNSLDDADVARVILKELLKKRRKRYDSKKAQYKYILIKKTKYYNKKNSKIEVKSLDNNLNNIVGKTG